VSKSEGPYTVTERTRAGYFIEDGKGVRVGSGTDWKSQADETCRLMNSAYSAGRASAEADLLPASNLFTAGSLRAAVDTAHALVTQGHDAAMQCKAVALTMYEGEMQRRVASAEAECERLRGILLECRKLFSAGVVEGSEDDDSWTSSVCDKIDAALEPRA